MFRAYQLYVTALLLCLTEQVTGSVRAPFSSPKHNTHDSILVEWEEYQSQNGGIVDFYELSYRPSFDPHWHIADGGVGSSGVNRTQSQILSIRVDEGKDLSSTKGTFTLGINYGGLNPQDFEHTARTPRIPYDATAAQLNTALSFLTAITVLTVKRCDEFGTTTIANGGFEEWMHSCPYGDRGGFRWLIVFKTVAREATFPKLYAYRENLGNTWSGLGEQVSVSRIHGGAVGPSLCSDRLCSYKLEELDEATPYLFRVRTHQNIIGWTDYTPTSASVFTKQFRAPAKPRVPVAMSTQETSISYSIMAPSNVQGVLFFESNYRKTGDEVWMTGPTLDVSDNIDASEYTFEYFTLLLTNLTPGASYELRVRAVNAAGVSPFSSVTVSATTNTNAQESAIVLPPRISTDGVASQSIIATIEAKPDANVAIYKNNYKLEYKQSNRNNWVAMPQKINLSIRKVGVEVQEISVRSDSPQGCNGFFWVKLQGAAPDLVDSSVTSAIPFAATEEEFVAAILDIPRITRSGARVSARRKNNEFNGYTWVIDIEGMGNIEKFQNDRNDLTNRETGDVCWTGAGFVTNTRTIKDGYDVLTPAEAEIQVTGLTPQTPYDLRVVRYDDRSSAKTVSEVVHVTTTALFGAPPESDVVAEERNRDSFNPFLAGQYAVGGFGSVAARNSDFHYGTAIGEGGDSGVSGSNGECVVISFSPKRDQAYVTDFYFFEGKVVQHFVPVIESHRSQILRLTIKCWGGGGGGGQLSNYENLVEGVEGAEKLSQGGGGAFAQISLDVYPGEVFNIQVAGGGKAPQGEYGGDGGYSGGGKGGNALRGGGGGGGGGCSVVTTADGTLVLVAAGGAGGGSTDYCCGHGGAGGGSSTGQRGLFSGDVTPWPLASVSRPTPVTRRNEYTSPLCPAGVEGLWCTSPWDVEPMSLPAEHLNLEYGESPNANYTNWAEGGYGGSLLAGGIYGASGNYQTNVAGNSRIVPFDEGRASMYGQDTRSAIFPAQQGRYLSGGAGASWKKGGGGGGAGYYGGGGGGSGYDAAGGGGGISYVNTALAINNDQTTTVGSVTPTPHVSYLAESSVEISWSGMWTDSRGRYASKYIVEISEGLYSEDFSYVATVDVQADAQNEAVEKVYAYLIDGLEESSNYVVRTVPLLRHGRGEPSGSLRILTLQKAENYWEPVVGHRNAISASGRGLTAPALMRPHLDTGVEVFASRTTENALRITDSRTADTPELPSSRRGQSMSLVDSYVYMFGGRTDGYTCAFTFKDTLDLGTPVSGRNVYPCASVKNEVNELWRFDIYDYRWVYINVFDDSVAGGAPSPREQHSSGVMNGDIYVFGGKSRGAFPSTKDNVFDDMWRLIVQPNVVLDASYQGTLPTRLPEGFRATFLVNMTDHDDPYLSKEIDSDVLETFKARSGSCITDLSVSVSFYHPCVSQLRISLQGPGPSTGSPNFLAHSYEEEVLLFDQHKINTTACAGGNFTFVFDEDGDHATSTCCAESGVHSFRPDGRLYEYLGASPYAEWTLIIEDMSIDGFSTELYDFDISFDLTPCQREYYWEKVVAVNPDEQPEARYQAKMIVYEDDFFLFGGRGDGDTILTDLHRFNRIANGWTMLTPRDFDLTFNTASMVGMNIAVTTWGIIRFGGYIRLPSMSDGDSYVNEVYLMDPISLHWRRVEVESGGNARLPLGRYLSSSVFIPSSAMRWRTQFSYRTLFDQRIISTHANFAGSNADSLLIFGGHNGATGSLEDGSTGGMLNDMWQLRLANWSLTSNRDTHNSYVERSCKWRTTGASTSDCVEGIAGATCKLRDLLLLAWCNRKNQTMG
jgi:hypothetical protein